MTNRILAWLNLAAHFARHVLFVLPLRPFRAGRDAARFMATVGPEGYLPLNDLERAQLPAAMRCIHCGLCSLACPALRAAPASAWQESWTFVAGPSRSLDRASLVDAASPCARCDACAAVCPARLPIPEIAAMLGRLADARVPGSGPLQ